MKKRLLSLVLALVLLIGVLPGSIFAVEEEDLAERLRNVDLSKAAEITEVTFSERQDIPKRYETKANTNICFPSVNTYAQHAQYGQEMILEFTLFSFGGYNQEFVILFFADPEMEEDPIAGYIGDYPTYVGSTDFTLSWDTQTLSNGAGEYYIVCYTYYNDKVDEIYETYVALTEDYIPLQKIYFEETEYYEAIYNQTMLPGDELDYVLGYYPYNASTPDRRTTVSSSNTDDATVESLGGFYTVTAHSCGEVAINAQSAGKSAVLYVKVDHLDADGDYYCDYAPCWRLMFTDVSPDTWYYKAVSFAVRNGLMNGMGDNLFQPDGAMTRAQLVTVLWRYEGSPVSGVNTFTDVGNNLWYTQAVAWAAERGIVSGVGNNKFNPDGTITREQLVTIFFRYSAMKGLSTSARTDLSSFPDKDKVSPWALDAVQWAVSVGLISGNAHSGSTWLESQGNATRAQVSVIFQRFIENTPNLTIEKKVALVTDYGSITDASFNQAAYIGVKNYCEAHGVAYTYYQPTDISTEEYVVAIEQAIAEGATVVVLPGYAFGAALLQVQDLYPDVKFIALDVAEGDLTEDYVSYGKPSANTVCVTYKEEQAGYLAGYAAVKAGYIQLGFVGGMAVPAVIRYGYGFIQGANAAAEEMGLSDLVEIRYVYANQFYGDADITAYMDALYASGTEVIFSCGGGILTSVAEAALKADGEMIGADVDLSVMIESFYGEDITFTSAMKGLSYTTEFLLAEYFDSNTWYGGQCLRLGAEHGGTAQYSNIMLPASTQFNNGFTEADYTARWNLIAQGRVIVSDEINTEPEVAISVYYLPSIK